MTNGLSDSEFYRIIGVNPIFIFPTKTFGGHELMTLKMFDLLKSFECNITAAVDDQNHKLIRALKDNYPDIKIKKLPFNQSRFEFLHTLFNLYKIVKTKTFISQIEQECYSKIILVQGDIELGSVFLGKYPDMDKIISYIPYAHSAKKMSKHLYFIRDLFYPVFFNRNKNYLTICNVFRDEILSINKNAKVYVFENKVRDLNKYKKLRSDFICMSEPLNKRKLIITMLGRISFRQKGQDILIKALGLLDKIELNNIVVNIIGDGPDKKSLESMIKIFGLEKITNIYGWENEPWDIAYNTDVIVIPSRFEGVPLVMLESLELGIDVLATNTDGMIDYLPKTNLFIGEEQLKDLISNKIISF